MDAPKQPASQPNQQPPDEKLEFLKREEVRTMAKDIARIREGEAKKERERIANFKREANLPKKPQVVLSQEPSQKKQEEPKRPLIPRRPLRRSEKLFIRLVVGGIIVFLIFNVVAFGFWYFPQRDGKPQPEPQDVQQVTQPPTPPPVVPEPQSDAGESQVKPPAAFFEAPEQELFIELPEELLPKLQDFLGGAPALGFTNLAVKTKEDILSRKDFLQGAEITMPQELEEKLTENLMLFSYVAEQKKRLGFIAELKEAESVPGLLQSWEQSMEQDLASFFDIIGDKGPTYTSLFHSSVYRGIPVRFQTFSVIDFGIVYGIVQDKLLLTSSLESFQKVVDQLQAI